MQIGKGGEERKSQFPTFVVIELTEPAVKQP